ncbi:receptor like protein 27-like [Macadamia integrifolia]|uniref:receptor like protein 27-like n=1 Tax=Macadamia integrifolia TaxID=60698 RepID=UPI001C4FCADD|nr:receptor like protein 27-like [Macadamia integrifolia]
MNQKEMFSLDLSSNRIDGAIPKWIWQKNLLGLDLSNNSLTGLELPLPNDHSFNIELLDLHSNKIQDCLSMAPCFPQTFNQSCSEFVSPILGNLTSLLSKANLFSISENNLTGKIPFSLCNASNLGILDLSNNQLSGVIPTCLASSNLGVLNLENNKLHGPIPPTFKNGCSLQTLKLNKNMLQGEVPRSLCNCKELKVLDIGDNQLNDTFPYWLENLSELQVLVIRSNKFGGPIAQLPQADSPFLSLHVIDLSFNAFTGSLPLQYILHWRAMMIVENNSVLNYISLSNSSSYYLDTLVVMDKVLYLKMPILTTFSTIDLSNNNFKGEIPHALGNLKALIVLNLSGNSLTGQIPLSFGNLSKLESLDLSRNQLSGEIPRQLTSLTFLSALNVSYNNLVGGIPQGSQFDTFSNASYEGNAELCGLPLSRKCGVTNSALPPASTSQQDDDSTSLLDWKFVVARYCSGLIIGLVAGQQLFWKNNRYFGYILRIRGSKQRKGLKKKHHNRRK